MKIIECKDLTKEYISSDSTVKAVDNVSISFEQGEFCAVTGPSGSGKSTFLHILSSLENATSGYVIYGEKRLSDYSDNQLSILRRRRFVNLFLIKHNGQNYVFISRQLVYKIVGQAFTFAVCAFGRPATENCDSKSARKQTVNTVCRRAYG